VEEYKLGLVLSGGGVKGAVHLGVMKAMNEHGVKASFISGTSAGALAGVFCAAGYSSEKVLEIFSDQHIFSLNSFTWAKPGLMNIETTMSFLEPYFGGKTFETLKQEMHIVATDLISGADTTFSSGPLIKPLLASCAFPFIFAPVEINDSVYVDGGVVNNFPVEVISKNATHILGVYVSPLRKIDTSYFNNTVNVLDRVYRISNRHSSLEKLKDCTWIINPPELENYGTFTISKIKEIFDLGYKYGNKLFSEIKDELSNFKP